MELGLIIGLSILVAIIAIVALLFSIFLIYKTLLVRRQVKREAMRMNANNKVKDKDLNKVKKHAGVIARIKLKLKREKEIEAIADEIVNK